ncbi:hypothetical protein [Halomonas citrativorans]|uniref:Uncharacterized protein n=1 Tax=Halomonas citrativorans TaxID=2742612 RepID=A0ABR9FG97_9GAMM|nr:hypothetical protein [Halomonas citrativorans]MBE0405021.1 hypothetical protein [Halomonas citrativorans]
MLVDATVIPYDIESLGYYKQGVTPNGFPSYLRITEEFVKWGRSVSQIENTRTYAKKDYQVASDTYFVDGYFDSTDQDAVIVLWKEVKNHKGNIYGISKGMQPGKGVATKKSLGNKYIPGYPIYFWLRPKDKKLVTFIFEHSDQGKSNFHFYLNGYLEKKATPWVVNSKVKQPDGSYDVFFKGFSHDGNALNIDKDIEIKLDFRICKRGDDFEYLKSEIKNIRRLQKVEKINIDLKTGVSKSGGEVFYNKFFERLGVSKSLPDVVRYKSEVPWTPGVKELTEVYDNAIVAHRNGELISLKAITNAQKKISFFSNHDKSSVELNIANGFSGFISANALYSAIQTVIDDLP